MSFDPYEFDGFKVIDVAPMTDMEFLEAAENDLWAAYMHAPHDEGLCPIVKSVGEESGVVSWQVGEIWTSFDEARRTACEYAAHVLRMQDPDVRDQALVRHFITRTLVRIEPISV